VQSASLDPFTSKFRSTAVTSPVPTGAGIPSLRFPAAPLSVDVHVLDRPGQPFLGTGEAGQGPTAAAIANALRQATGVRLRNLPLSRERVKAAVGV